MLRALHACAEASRARDHASLASDAGAAALQAHCAACTLLRSYTDAVSNTDVVMMVTVVMMMMVVVMMQ